MSERLTMENFTGLVGKTCLLKEEDKSHEIELIEITKLKKRSDKGHPEPFVVEIRCKEEEILPQRIYKLSRAGEILEDKDIFFSPVGQDAQGHLYEAVFN